MADSNDIDDIDGGEPSEESAAPKKKKGGGLAALLPALLKFAAIGIGAVVFMVTVAVVTVNVMNSSGRSQTVVVDPSSPYIGRRPIFAWYTDIGPINTRTRDTAPHMVTVQINLGYDREDTVTASELNNRKLELQAFVRRHFAGKTAEDLRLENEPRIQREIMEMLNTRYLDSGRIRAVSIQRLDVMEVF
jgi:flagellar FliL protein